jgi:hypothetical protein
MGIGDKQRMESERYLKYAEAIHKDDKVRSAVDRVLALVDAEIEPLQEQIDEDGIRLGTLIGKVVWLEDVLEGLPDGIVRNAETRGDLDRMSVMACAAYVRGTIEGYKIKRDHGVKEPEYEYGFRDEWNVPYPATFSSVEDAQEYVDRRALSPKEYTMTRRRKAGRWEDVK